MAMLVDERGDTDNGRISDANAQVATVPLLTATTMVTIAMWHVAKAIAAHKDGVEDADAGDGRYVKLLMRAASRERAAAHLQLPARHPARLLAAVQLKGLFRLRRERSVQEAVSFWGM